MSLLETILVQGEEFQPSPSRHLVTPRSKDKEVEVMRETRAQVAVFRQLTTHTALLF